MKKVLLGTFLGFVLFALSLGLAFLYFVNEKDGMTPLVLIPSVLLLGASAYVLFRSGTYDIYKVKLKALTGDAAKAQGALNKNDAIVKEWGKTAQARDKLKILEMAAVVEEDKK